MGKYWNEEIECMAHEDMKKLQSERLVKQVKHVWDNVPYYKKLMEEKGVTPDDIHGIEDLHKLPFLSKADLREAYPYGLLAKPLSECVRIHSTSGTTGKRVVAFYTQHDIDLWENCCARAIVAAGGTKAAVSIPMQNLMCFSCCLIMRQRKIFIGGTKPYHDPLLRFFNGRGEGESLAVSLFQCSDIVYGCFFFNNNRRAFSTRDGIYAIFFFLKKQLVFVKDKPP